MARTFRSPFAAPHIRGRKVTDRDITRNPHRDATYSGDVARLDRRSRGLGHPLGKATRLTRRFVIRNGVAESYATDG